MYSSWNIECWGLWWWAERHHCWMIICEEFWSVMDHFWDIKDAVFACVARRDMSEVEMIKKQCQVMRSLSQLIMMTIFAIDHKIQCHWSPDCGYHDHVQTIIQNCAADAPVADAAKMKNHKLNSFSQPLIGNEEQEWLEAVEDEEWREEGSSHLSTGLRIKTTNEAQMIITDKLNTDTEQWWIF